MTRILMVCLGNICRSPIAHGCLEFITDPYRAFVDSAGTAAYHIGERPDQRSINISKNKGIDISHQRARQFCSSDFDSFDIIYAMDKSNFENIIKLAKNNEQVKKVKLFLDENPNVASKNVPDPYYGDLSDFEKVFNLAEETCRMIAKKFDLSIQ